MKVSSADAMLLGRLPGSVGRVEDTIAGAERLLENSGFDEGEDEVAGEGEKGGEIGDSTIRKVGHASVEGVPTHNYRSECKWSVARCG
jgi:hypothetical protein